MIGDKEDGNQGWAKGDRNALLDIKLRVHLLNTLQFYIVNYNTGGIRMWTLSCFGNPFELYITCQMLVNSFSAGTTARTNISHDIVICGDGQHEITRNHIPDSKTYIRAINAGFFLPGSTIYS